MVDMSTAFEGDYLSAKDYEEGERLVLTVRDVTAEDFEDRETKETVSKFVLYFNEKKPGLVLNRGNGRTLIQLYGKDSDAWVGKKVALLVTSSPVGMYFKLLDKAPKEAASQAI
jgi:hypothetical protein